MDDDPLLPIGFKPLTAERFSALEQRAAIFEAALRHIATPRRPDGTYNLCREACESLAQAALQQGMQYEKD